jgi:hypothetical protein
MRAKYDILWKGMLERVFDDFLRFVFPNADRRFDMKKGFTYLDKELAELDRGVGYKICDKLVRVYTQQVHLVADVEYDLVHWATLFVSAKRYLPRGIISPGA